MSWLTDLLRLPSSIPSSSHEPPCRSPRQGGGSQASPYPWPRQDDEETELDRLRREVYEQRIKITGLSKKLKSLQMSVTQLKRERPGIHKTIFPLPSHAKRK